MYTSYVFIALAIIAVFVVFRTATVVPQQSAYVVENLGKYSRTLQAGFHILIPFVERVAYRHSLKEQALDVPEQICITKDNVQVAVDAVLYMQVLDPHLASYGITNYSFAIGQLAQTTLRSEIGKIELDRTFEARATINANVVSELDKASEATKQQQINEADGQAAALLAVATATAEGLRRVGGALSERGGIEAMQLRIGEEYVRQFGKLAKESTTLVVPGNLSDLAAMVSMATSIIRGTPPQPPDASPRPGGRGA